MMDAILEGYPKSKKQFLVSLNLLSRFIYQDIHYNLFSFTYLFYFYCMTMFKCEALLSLPYV